MSVAKLFTDANVTRFLYPPNHNSSSRLGRGRRGEGVGVEGEGGGRKGEGGGPGDEGEQE